MRGITIQQAERITELYEKKGVPVSAISIMTKVSRQGIYNLLKRRGIFKKNKKLDKKIEKYDEKHDVGL